jgi:hypothetical protein
LALDECARGEAPLPSWNEGSAKQRIIKFVREVATIGNPQFVKPEERVAVFEALNEANTKGWTVVDMKQDWKRIYPFEK